MASATAAAREGLVEAVGLVADRCALPGLSCRTNRHSTGEKGEPHASPLWGDGRGEPLLSACSLWRRFSQELPRLVPNEGIVLTAPDPRGFPSRARLELDTQHIVRFVERRTGLLSRWRGEVRIAHPDAPWLGLKHPECWIEYHPQLLGDAEFYYVALEEALHACSVLLPVADRPLSDLVGVEEATVAGCLEVLKPAFRALFVSDALSAVAQLPGTGRERLYGPNLRALGSLRRRCGLDAESFYLGLLGTALAFRWDRVVGWIGMREDRSLSAVSDDETIRGLWSQVEQEE